MAAARPGRRAHAGGDRDPRAARDRAARRHAAGDRALRLCRRLARLCRLRRQPLHVGRGGLDHRADLRRRAVLDRRHRHRALRRAGHAAGASWSGSSCSSSACCGPAGSPTLLSIPVTTGFLAGISIHIIVGELPALLGARGADGHMLVRLACTSSAARGEPTPIRLRSALGVLIVTIARGSRSATAFPAR